MCEGSPNFDEEALITELKAETQTQSQCFWSRRTALALKTDNAATDSKLPHLLRQLNTHIQNYGVSEEDRNTIFDGFEIIDISQSDSKLCLNEIPRIREENPLVILSIGSGRSMDIIPKKHGTNHPCGIYDVMLHDRTVVTIYPETRRQYNISIARATSNTTQGPGGSFVIIPTCSSNHNIEEDSESEDDLNNTVIEAHQSTTPARTMGLIQKRNLHNETTEESSEIAGKETTEGPPKDTKKGTSEDPPEDTRKEITDEAPEEIPNSALKEPAISVMPTAELHEANSTEISFTTPEKIRQENPDQARLKAPEDSHGESPQKTEEEVSKEPASLAFSTEDPCDPISADNSPTTLVTTDRGLPGEYLTEILEKAHDQDETQEVLSEELMSAIIPTMILNEYDCTERSYNTPVIKDVEQGLSDKGPAKITEKSQDQDECLEIIQTNVSEEPTSLVTPTKELKGQNYSEISPAPTERGIPEDREEAQDKILEGHQVAAPEQVSGEALDAPPSLANRFIQRELYYEIISKLASSTCKIWAKECELSKNGTASEVKKTILAKIDRAATGSTKLPLVFLDKLVNKLTDAAVKIELFNFGIKENGKSAKARKGQVLTYLGKNFSDQKIDDLNSTIKDENKRLGRNSSIKKSKKSGGKRKGKSSTIPVAAEPVDECQEETPESTSSTTPTPSSDSTHIVDPVEDRPTDCPGKKKLTVPDPKTVSPKSPAKPADVSERSDKTFHIPCEAPITMLQKSIMSSKRDISALQSCVALLENKSKKEKEVPKDDIKLSKRLDTLENQYLSLVKLFDEHHTQILKNESSIEKCQIKCDDQSAILRKQVADDMNETHKPCLVAQNDPFYKRIDSPNLQNDALQSKVDDLELLNTQHQSVIKDLENTNYKLRLTIRNMEDRLEGRDTVIGSLKQCLSTLSTNLAANKDCSKSSHYVCNSVPTQQPPAILNRNTVEKEQPLDPTTYSNPNDPATTNCPKLAQNGGGAKSIASIGSQTPSSENICYKPSEAGTKRSMDVNSSVRSDKKVASVIVINDDDVTTGTVAAVGDSSVKGTEPTGDKQKKVPASTKGGSGKPSAPESREPPNKPSLTQINTASLKIRKDSERERVTPHDETKPPKAKVPSKKIPSATTRKDSEPNRTSSNDKSTDRKNAPSWTRITGRCLLVHDGDFDNFQSSLFPKDMHVHPMKVKNLNNLLSHGNIASKVQQTKSDMVYCHLGNAELWLRENPEDVVNSMKMLIWKILEQTQSKICISLAIPLKPFPNIYGLVTRYNFLLSQFIESVRDQRKYRSRIITQNNNRVTSHVTRTIGPKAGFSPRISEVGKNILWSKLREGMERTLSGGSNASRDRSVHE